MRTSFGSFAKLNALLVLVQVIHSIADYFFSKYLKSVGWKLE